MTITTEEARNLMRTRIPYSGYLLDVCEERDQLRAQLEQERALRRQDVARGLTLRAEQHNAAASRAYNRKRRDEARLLWRRVSLLRRWAESVRMGRDIPAWKNQP